MNMNLLSNYFTRNLDFYYDKYFEYDKDFKSCTIRALNYYMKGYIKYKLKNYDKKKFNEINLIIKNESIKIPNSIFCNYLKIISIF